MSTSSPSSSSPYKTVLFAIAVLLVLLGLYTFSRVLVTALVGVLLGVLLEPLIRWLRRHLHLPHGVSVALTALLLIGLVGGLFYAGYAAAAPQVQKLADNGPAMIQRMNEQVEALASRFSWLGINTEQLKPGAWMGKVGAALTKMLTVGLEGISYILVVFMISLFLAANFGSYGRGVLTLFPAGWRPRIAELGRESVALVRRWFFSQLVVVSISGVLTAVAMLLIGIDYWLVIAVLTMVLDVIPFFGALVTGLVAALVTIGSEPEKIWWVLIAYLVIQQIENDVTLPLVMKGRIRIPEAHLLIFLLLMGSAFGVVGIFLSPPVFAVLHHLYVSAYVPWMNARTAPPARPLR